MASRCALMCFDQERWVFALSAIFRFFVEEQAQSAGITGWVRNCPNGEVECEAKGSRQALEGWIDRLRKGPPLSRVEGVAVEWKRAAQKFTSFEIR